MGTPVKPVGVVIPTRWEAGTIQRRFGFSSIGAATYQAVIRDRTVWLAISGVGRIRAAAAAERLCAAGAGELISMGFCGALVPDLKVGDLVTERIATVDSPARTPGERQTLTHRANAVAVDMETQAIVEVGTRRGVPIRVLRVVSDTFQDDLAPLLGSAGGFSAWRIGLWLLNPRLWPLAVKLKRHSDLAKERLADVLDALLRSSSPRV